MKIISILKKILVIFILIIYIAGLFVGFYKPEGLGFEGLIFVVWIYVGFFHIVSIISLLLTHIIRSFLVRILIYLYFFLTLHEIIIYTIYLELEKLDCILIKTWEEIYFTVDDQFPVLGVWLLMGSILGIFLTFYIPVLLLKGKSNK